MCAVAGACTHNPEVNAANRVLSALDATQHRGEDSTGIGSLSYEGDFDVFSAPGVVRFAYPEDEVHKRAGAVALGSNRYGTSGKGYIKTPIHVDDMELALAHNGTLSVTDDLGALLARSHVPIQKLNDTGLMTESVVQIMRQDRDLPEAVEEFMPLIKGAASCVVQHRDTLVAFRDSFGLRPLSIAEIDGGYMFSSETCGFYSSRPHHAQHIGDVQPGEMVVVQDGEMWRKQVLPPTPKFDIFELIYFASEDSEMFGQSVGQIRYKMGLELAEQFPFSGDNYLVVGVPDSGLPIAEGYADGTGLQKRNLFKKHRYWGGRSFLQPDQESRKDYLRRKFSYISGVANNRDLIIIDDSKVRQNTAEVINELAMRAGAKSVRFLFGCPPIGHPDFSGIDTPDQNDLSAFRQSPEEVRRAIGVRGLGYLGLNRLIRATGQPAEVFNLASFTGEYPYDIGKRVIETSVSLKYLYDAYAEAA